MKKPAQLKAHLLMRTPWLKEDPSRFAIYVDNGSIRATGAGASLSHELAYKLVLVILDYPGGPEQITAPILEWIKIYQSDMRDNPDWQRTGMLFEVEPMNKGTVDMKITLEVTERITVADKDPQAQATEHRFHIVTEDEPQRDDLLSMDWAFDKSAEA